MRFPLNGGAYRDIPPGALFHHSVIERMQEFPGGYKPQNDISLESRVLRLDQSVPVELRPGDSPPKAEGPYFILDHNLGTQQTDEIYKLKYD